MADLYTGYNAITMPGRRRRARCLAHARRKIFEAKHNPEAQEALDLIRDVYVVEHDARELGVEGSVTHRAMRTLRSRPLMARPLVWGRAQRRTHGPKTLLGLHREKRELADALLEGNDQAARMSASELRALLT
jgi:transposase